MPGQGRQHLFHDAVRFLAGASDLSTDPVIATHHGLRTFSDSPRTMPEAQLRKLAAKGGIIGIHIGNEFHNRRLSEWRARNGSAVPTGGTPAAGPGMTAEQIDVPIAPGFPLRPPPRPPEEVLMTVDEWLQVVDWAIEVAGEDHVALGTDFDGGGTLPRGFRDVRDLPLLTEAMLRHRYSQVRIEKFLGGNLLRCFRQITSKH